MPGGHDAQKQEPVSPTELHQLHIARHRVLGVSWVLMGQVGLKPGAETSSATAWLFGLVQPSVSSSVPPRGMSCSCTLGPCNDCSPTHRGICTKVVSENAFFVIREKHMKGVKESLG